MSRLAMEKRERVQSAKRLVVKLGSAVVTTAAGGVDRQRIADICSQAAHLHRAGKEIIIITSGAIRAGLHLLASHLPKRAETGKGEHLPLRQAAAAVGQSELIACFREAMAAHGILIAQVLVTQADIADSRRHLHLRNLLFGLLREHRAVPVLNENDPVSGRGLEIGENDRLAALIAARVDADLLVVLSDVEGFFTSDPRADPTAKLIPEVTQITHEIARLARDTSTAAGTGGMQAKLEAARTAAKSGIFMIVAKGTVPDVLLRIAGGEPVGTLFVPGSTRLRLRKRWIAFARRPAGYLVVDDGAARALVERGSSLLPVGVIEVGGDFRRGDNVSVRDLAGKEIARGLVNFSAEETRRIRRKKSPEVEAVLGSKQFEEVIHRDNLVVL
jgi:glutamate 5-kinase